MSQSLLIEPIFVNNNHSQTHSTSMMNPSHKSKLNHEENCFEDLANFEEEELRVMTGKYDILLNYLKQLNLIISVLIRSYRAQTASMLKQIIFDFDKAVEDYNSYYLSVRCKHTLYFSLDPTIFYQSKINKFNLFNLNRDKQQIQRYLSQIENQSSVWLAQNGKTVGKNTQVGIQSIQNEDFILNLVFTRFTPDGIPEFHEKFYLHLELWKKASTVKQQNEILNRYEALYTFELFQKLLNEGYVDHFEPNHCIALKLRNSGIGCTNWVMHPGYSNLNQKQKQKQKKKQKQTLQEFNVLEMIEKECKGYVKELKKIFQGEERLVCAYCNNYTVYDSKINAFVPPTIKIEKQAKSQAYYHEICGMRFLVPFRKKN